MYTIDTNELLEYMTCPYKLTFKDVQNSIDSFVKLKSTIYNILFDQCIYIVLNGSSVTIPKINEKLNYVWNELRNKLSFVPILSDKLIIKNKLFKLQDLFKSIDYVVYYDVPRLIDISNTTITYRINSFVANSELKTFVKIDNGYYNISNDSYSVKLLTNLIYYDLKKADPKLKHNIYLYRCDTADIYNHILIDKKELDSCIKNVIHGMENKIIYPRNDYITCNNCKYKKICYWSLSDK